MPPWIAFQGFLLFARTVFVRLRHGRLSAEAAFSRGDMNGAASSRLYEQVAAHRRSARSASIADIPMSPRRKNVETQVTGVLLATGDCFAQVLAGEQEASGRPMAESPVIRSRGRF